MDGRVVVVGAGLSGLSAAVHLAAAGRDVVVVEARDEPGGCCGSAQVGPYRFDTGPSVLTMPQVLADTFGAAGEDLGNVLPLRRLDPFYRLSFHDGSRLDVVAGEQEMAGNVRELCGPAEAARYVRFRRRLGAMFEAEWSSFIDADVTRLRSMARPVALLRLAAAGGFRRLDRFVASSLTDERLIKAHTFQALYVGLPPGRALAIYAVVAHMDTVGGVYFPVTGGMHAVPRALASSGTGCGPSGSRRTRPGWRRSGWTAASRSRRARSSSPATSRGRTGGCCPRRRATGGCGARGTRRPAWSCMSGSTVRCPVRRTTRCTSGRSGRAASPRWPAGGRSRTRA